MVTGKRFGGIEAKEKHLVDAAVAESEVLPASLEIARRVGGKDRSVLGTIKQRMYRNAIELLSNSQGTQPA
jgi:enoyl-CoA hydratase/carnithine racemase